MRRLLLLILFAVTPTRAEGQDSPPELAAYRSDLQYSTRDGTWWWTSNAGQARSGGEPDAFGMRTWMDPGGISATGCLWTIKEGRREAIIWIFHQGWDGAEGEPFFYQSHATGLGTGMGHQTARESDTTEMVQEFWWSNGVHQRTKHRTRKLDDDTYVGESLAWTDGEWRADRTYTWQRRPASTPLPCGPVSQSPSAGAFAPVQPHLPT